MQRFYRRLSPPRAARYNEYRAFLRYEFRFLCSYCGIHEDEYGVFEVDHFRPQARFPQLESDYANLYYSCRRCNNYKRDFWPSAEDEAAGLKFIDPCQEDLLGVHAEVLACGALRAKTPAGDFTIGHLGLNRSALARWRRKRREQIQRHYEAVAGFKETLTSFDEVLREVEGGRAKLPAELVARLRRSRADCEIQLEEVLQHFGPVQKPIDED